MPQTRQPTTQWRTDRCAQADVPHYMLPNPWRPSIGTTASTTWPRLLEQYQLANALGAYQSLLWPIGTQTANNWLAVNATSATTTAGWPAFVYQREFPQAFDVPMPPARHRTHGMGRSPAIIHAGRRAVRRSIDLYLRMRPEEELKQFIAGREIIVQGARFRYKLRKTHSIMEHTIDPIGGHIPYRLHMMDLPPRDDLPVASGCVYLERTPILDQVLAFIMHVTDPAGEREIIRRTNWSPHLPERVLQRLEMAPIEADPLLRELIEVSEGLGIAA